MKTRSIPILGLGLIALGTLLTFLTSVFFMSLESLAASFGWSAGWLVAVAGIIVMLMGGVKGKPQYIWIGTIVIGLIYISSFYVIIHRWIEENQLEALIYFLSPGLACIITGTVMQRFSRRSSH